MFRNAVGIRRGDAIAGLALLVCGCAKRAEVSRETSAPTGELLASVRRRGTLRVATDGNYFPQSYRNADGSWAGFDIDVARELARRLGVATQLDDVSFDLITAGHWSGRFDAHVGSMTVTAERKTDLRFTRPYYYIPATFAVHATSALARIGQLDGKRGGGGRALAQLRRVFERSVSSRNTSGRERTDGCGECSRAFARADVTRDRAAAGISHRIARPRQPVYRDAERYGARGARSPSKS